MIPFAAWPAGDGGTNLCSCLAGWRNGAAFCYRPMAAWVVSMACLRQPAAQVPTPPADSTSPPRSVEQGAAAVRLTKALDAALGVKCTVQAGRPLYDARAAILLLLMGRVLADPSALQQLEDGGGRVAGDGRGRGGDGGSFFASLLNEHDSRLRHYAAAFVLRQLLVNRPAAYRRALRAVVARAQQVRPQLHCFAGQVAPFHHTWSVWHRQPLYELPAPPELWPRGEAPMMALLPCATGLAGCRPMTRSCCKTPTCK